MQSQFFENMKIIKDLIGQLSVFFFLFLSHRALSILKGLRFISEVTAYMCTLRFSTKSSN